MLRPSRHHAHLLPAAPPYVAARGLRARLTDWRAQRRGRRDITQPRDGQGLQPTTNALHREVDGIAAQTDAALRDAISASDTTLAALVARRATLLDATAVRRRELADHLAGAIPDEALARGEHTRTEQRLTEQVAAVDAELATVVEQIRQAWQQRLHLHVVADDIVNTWAARCDELVQLHARGYWHRLNKKAGTHRTGGTPQAEVASPPRYATAYRWATEQIPIEDPVVLAAVAAVRDDAT